MLQEQKAQKEMEEINYKWIENVKNEMKTV